MAIRSTEPIYQLIEQYLKNSDSPLTCVDLWHHQDVQNNARSPEKVSDYLGLMWRRGLIQRWHAPKTATDRSRYAYSWIDDASAAIPRRVEHLSIVGSTHKKANVTVTEEEDRLILDFDKFTMIIQAKG